jgi:hypothetical protein
MSRMNNFRPLLPAAIFVASVVSPIFVWRHTRAELRHLNESLQWQTKEIAAARTNQFANKNASPARWALPDGDLREMMRLRAEAAALRRQTNESSAAVNKHRDSERSLADGQASSQSEEEMAAEISSETLEAMRGVLQALPEASQRYAQEHKGKAPQEFSELRKYFPQIDGRRMPGLYTFQFVREEGPKAGDVLILKEQSFRSHGGFVSRMYGFNNGEATEVTVSDERAQRNFFQWESQHLNQVAAAQSSGNE